MTVDYFGRYFTSEGFDFPDLINDDFMSPIRLLFQNKHYVSSAKLLMSMIDSLGYVEYGDAKACPFVAWLKAYADLDALNITAEELWEHRNSLLHMSNLDSRKVRAGRCRRLMIYVGDLPPDIPRENQEGKYYDLRGLVLAIADACSRWFASYNSDRQKITEFVSRYDLITSDNRMLWLEVSEGSA